MCEINYISIVISATTYRPSEGEVELQGGGFDQGEGVRAECVTRYIAEAAGADGSDV